MIKKRFLFVIILGLSFNRNVLSQNKIVLMGTANYPELSEIKIISAIKNCVNNDFENIGLIKKDSISNSFYQEIKIDKPTTIFLRCKSTSHEIFVAPGDTLKININKLFRLDTAYSLMKNDVYREKIIYTGKNKFQYYFFDSLRSVLGTLNDVPFSFDYAKGSVEEFMIKNSLNYKKRVSFFINYINNKIVPPEFKTCVLAELRGAFLNNFIKFFIITGADIKKIPLNYINQFKNESFDWSTCSISRHYMSAAHNFITYILVKDPINKKIELKINEEIEGAHRNILDSGLANYLLTSSIYKYFDRPLLNFNSVLNKYFKYCSNENYKTAIHNLYDSLITRNEEGITDSLKVITKLINYNGDTVSLGGMLPKGKLILLDFWASWCKPCLREIPYSKTFSEKYKGKINFIYISLDKRRAEWEKAKKNIGLKENQYLLLDAGESQFVSLLKINTIPRYVLISKNSKRIIFFRTVYPSNVKSFDKMLKDGLKKIYSNVD